MRLSCVTFAATCVFRSESSVDGALREGRAGGKRKSSRCSLTWVDNAVTGYGAWIGYAFYEKFTSRFYRRRRPPFIGHVALIPRDYLRAGFLVEINRTNCHDKAIIASHYRGTNITADLRDQLLGHLSGSGEICKDHILQRKVSVNTYTSVCLSPSTADCAALERPSISA